jgi:hypothetical protein
LRNALQAMAMMLSVTSSLLALALSVNTRRNRRITI